MNAFTLTAHDKIRIAYLLSPQWNTQKKNNIIVKKMKEKLENGNNKCFADTRKYIIDEEVQIKRFWNGSEREKRRQIRDEDASKWMPTKQSHIYYCFSVLRVISSSNT